MGATVSHSQLPWPPEARPRVLQRLTASLCSTDGGTQRCPGPGDGPTPVRPRPGCRAKAGLRRATLPLREAGHVQPLPVGSRARVGEALGGLGRTPGCPGHLLGPVTLTAGVLCCRHPRQAAAAAAVAAASAPAPGYFCDKGKISEAMGAVTQPLRTSLPQQRPPQRHVPPCAVNTP